MKSGNLNFLETFRTLQTCNGTALPFFTQHMGKQNILEKTVASIPQNLQVLNLYGRALTKFVRTD